MTPAHERKAKERQRRKDAGEVRLEFWIPADKAESVRAAVAEALRADIHGSHAATRQIKPLEWKSVNKNAGIWAGIGGGVTTYQVKAPAPNSISWRLAGKVEWHCCQSWDDMATAANADHCARVLSLFEVDGDKGISTQS